MKALLALHVFGLPLPCFLVVLTLLAALLIVGLVFLDDYRTQEDQQAHQQLTSELQRRDAGKPFSSII